MAFQGWGSQTAGGAGGAVLHVTNLNGEGSGSFRAAVETPGARTIVFDVAGRIFHERPLHFTSPFFTVLGETAPYPGIEFGGEEFRIQTHDGILQHFAVRTGADDLPTDDWDNRDCITLSHPTEDIYNIVLDHLSLSWGVDECVSFGTLTHDCTISWCIVAEGLFTPLHPKGPHSMGLLVQNRTADAKISIHHNILASCVGRMPKVLGKKNDVRCNLVYNWGSFADGGKPLHIEGPESHLSFVNNYYIPGPDTIWPSSLAPLPMVVADTAPVSGFDFSAELYFAGNLMEGYEALAAWRDDNWDRFVYEFQTGQPLSRVWQSERPDSSIPLVTTQPTPKVKPLLLAHAGARAWERNATDRRIVRGIREKTGRIVSAPPA